MWLFTAQLEAVRWSLFCYLSTLRASASRPWNADWQETTRYLRVSSCQAMRPLTLTVGPATHCMVPERRAVRGSHTGCSLSYLMTVIAPPGAPLPVPVPCTQEWCVWTVPVKVCHTVEPVIEGTLASC